MCRICYLRIIHYVSVSVCATGPAREIEVCPRHPEMEKIKPPHMLVQFLGSYVINWMLTTYLVQ